MRKAIVLTAVNECEDVVQLRRYCCLQRGLRELMLAPRKRSVQATPGYWRKISSNVAWSQTEPKMEKRESY